MVKIHNPAIETWDPGEGPAFPKTFTFDSTYDQDSTTETIYNDICYPLIEVNLFIFFWFFGNIGIFLERTRRL